jgi:hypothetical protein
MEESVTDMELCMGAMLYLSAGWADIQKVTH